MRIDKPTDENVIAGQKPKAGEQLLTPDDVAAQLQVTSEQVRSLIRKRQLTAINISVGKKRPLYRITSKALAIFLDQRCQPSGPAQSRHFRRPDPTPDFFPDLR